MMRKKEIKKWENRLTKTIEDALEDGFEIEAREIRDTRKTKFDNGSKTCFPDYSRINSNTKKIIVDPRYNMREQGIGLNHELIHHYYDYFLDESRFKKLSREEKNFSNTDKKIDDLAVELYDSGVNFLEYLSTNNKV